jgi:hypothetical protein
MRCALLQLPLLSSARAERQHLLEGLDAWRIGE